MINESFQDARAAWLLLQRECDEPVTELELEDLKADVRSLNILGSVGYNKDSISLFRRELSDINGAFPTGSGIRWI